MAQMPLPSSLYPPALGLWHQRFRAPVEWRLTPSGVETRPSALQRPTADQLALLATIRRRYGLLIDHAAAVYNVPPELIEAAIATESSGNADSTRIEPGYISDLRTPGRLSVGLMQTLISTAQQVVPTGVKVTRAWLLVPSNSIQAGTAYIAAQRSATSYDPPLVAAAYNAGSVAHEADPRNPWRMRCYPLRTGEHVTRFVRHYNAALSLRPKGGV